MTYQSAKSSPLIRQMIRTGLGLLLAATAACGGKKDEDPGKSDSANTEPSDQLVSAGGAPSDEPEPQGPRTPLETEDGTCPEDAFIDFATGDCLEGDACPLGYAEVLLEEGGRKACEATPWLDQFGSEEDDAVVALQRDLNGNTIVLGSTGGRIEGAGVDNFDLFVRMYDEGGEVVWTRQFGSTKNDLAADLALGPDGRIYVVGRSFDLVESAEGGDIFVEVLNEDGFVYCLSDEGETMWHREIATNMPDEATAVAVDLEGLVHVVGTTSGALVDSGQNGGHDGFFVTYDSLGELLSTRVMGGALNDFYTDIALDQNGGFVMTGRTEGNIKTPEEFQGFDAFILRYDQNYQLDWTRPFGTQRDDIASALVIAADGTIYVGGDVGGQLGDTTFGGRDMFLRNYSPAGELQWTRQYGTEGQDRLHALSMGPGGLLYFAGDTTGSFVADKAGKMEGSLGVLSSDGELIDLRDFGTPEDDSIRALGVDEDGAAYLAGTVGAALPDQEHLGLLDASVAKLAFD